MRASHKPIGSDKSAISSGDGLAAERLKRPDFRSSRNSGADGKRSCGRVVPNVRPAIQHSMRTGDTKKRNQVLSGYDIEMSAASKSTQDGDATLA
jgi:hypothetical protein